MRSLAEIMDRRPNARCILVGGSGVSYGGPPRAGGTSRDVMLRTVGGCRNRSYFRGSLGSDTIAGHAGALDLIDYSERDGTHGVVATLAAGWAEVRQDGVLDETDTLVDIRGIWGSEGTDSLTASDHTDPDSFRGGAGNHTIDGAGAVDVADYRDATKGVTITLAAAGTETETDRETHTAVADDGRGGSDTLRSVEGLSRSNFDDVLTGNDGDDGRQGFGLALLPVRRFRRARDPRRKRRGMGGPDGESGSDTPRIIENLVGSGYSDSLIGNSQAKAIEGGEGEVWISGGAGKDTLQGGGDFDTFDYSYLPGTAGNDILVPPDAVTGYWRCPGKTDTIDEVEQLIASAGADYPVDQTPAAKPFPRWPGNDTIIGNAADYDFAVYTDRTASSPVLDAWQTAVP